MNELSQSLEQKGSSHFASLSSRLALFVKPSVAAWVPIPPRLIVLAMVSSSMASRNCPGGPEPSLPSCIDQAGENQGTRVFGGAVAATPFRLTKIRHFPNFCYPISPLTLSFQCLACGLCVAPAATESHDGDNAANGMAHVAKQYNDDLEGSRDQRGRDSLFLP
jgi:hypothetical protein